MKKLLLIYYKIKFKLSKYSYCYNCNKKQIKTNFLYYCCNNCK